MTLPAALRAAFFNRSAWAGSQLQAKAAALAVLGWDLAGTGDTVKLNPPVAETQRTHGALVLQTGKEGFLRPEGTATLSIVPAARPSPS